MITPTAGRSYGCEKCEALCKREEIRLPEDLERIMARAHEKMSSGTLVELESKSPLWRPFAEVFANGWGDIVSHEFKCAGCGQKFSLSADTFHGSGGEWCRRGT